MSNQNHTSDSHHPFLNPTLTPEFLDLHIIRTGILNALKSQMGNLNGRFLDVGAGNQPYRNLLEQRTTISEYVPLDLHDNQQYQDADNTWDGKTMPFADSEFDSAMATEVLEHCPDPSATLTEIHRVLKDRATLFLTVPFVWPLHDAPYDEYRYNPWSLERHLKDAGFTDINIWPTGGWDATLAQVIGLWVRRRPMSSSKRKLLTRLLYPVIKLLVRSDRPIKEFNNGFYLMPGLAASARASKT